MKPIEIYYSKTKYFFTFLGCVLFVILGIWMLSTPDTNIKTMLTAWGGIAFFGLGGLVSLWVILSPAKVGLQLNRNGITLSPAVFGKKFAVIPWKDINGFEENRTTKAKLIAIKLANPEKYIKKQPNAASRAAAEFNLRVIGTPYCLTAGAYQISHKKLLLLLREKLNECKK